MAPNPRLQSIAQTITIQASQIEKLQVRNRVRTNLSLSVGASFTYQVGNGGGPNVGGGATKTSGVSDRSRAHRQN
jgi:hypothetical protein